MKKILFCLPLLLLALQSCEIEDEYMYDKGLYTIDWDAAADRQRTVAVIGTTFMMIWSGLLSP